MNIDVAPPAGMQGNDFFIKNKKKTGALMEQRNEFSHSSPTDY